MHQPTPDGTTPIKFYKLRNSEDIVAYEVQITETHYHIRRPLSFSVENEVLAGRQMLNVREWIPPIVCANDSVILPKEEVLFSMDVKVSFRDEFIHATDYLYSVEAKPKKMHKHPKDDGVVPVILKDPSTKPN